MKTNATKSQVQKAIDNVNEKHGYKIEFNRADQQGKWFNFTIKSKSGIPGARVSSTGRNLACASWHAHGYLFDELLEINPDAIIHSNGLRIDSNGGNWIDKYIGSAYYSELSIL